MVHVIFWVRVRWVQETRGGCPRLVDEEGEDPFEEEDEVGRGCLGCGLSAPCDL